MSQCAASHDRPATLEVQGSLSFDGCIFEALDHARCYPEPVFFFGGMCTLAGILIGVDNHLQGTSGVF
jgi:hypothetical protein